MRTNKRSKRFVIPVSVLKATSGRDYLEQDDGRIIFSREYLYARGSCCGSKCLNCPYEFARVCEFSPIEDRRPVISMVPSWTETLIAAGANVVGRTRFCIHPHDAVRGIKVLGGTKNLSSDFNESMTLIAKNKAQSDLKPLVILDKEENPKDFELLFQSAGCEVFATEVTSLSGLKLELQNLSAFFSRQSQVSMNLRLYADRLGALMLSKQRAQHKTLGMSSGNWVTGFGEALLKDSISSHSMPLSEAYARLHQGSASLVYVIWKSPWMCVGRGTFIESVLKWLFNDSSSSLVWAGGSNANKYPKFDLHEVPANTFLVYASEPYPFEKELSRLPPGILVDGEKISWFGIRAIRYLENIACELIACELTMRPKAAGRDESKPL